MTAVSSGARTSAAVRLGRLLGGLACALLLAGCSEATAGTPVDQPDQNYVSGDGVVTEVAPADRGGPIELAGDTLAGARLDLADLRGAVVVVNVWGSWCPPCRKEAPSLKQASERLRDKGVQFVGIDTRDSNASAKAFLENVGIEYPNVADPDGELLLAFKGTLNPNAIPSTLVLDKQGRVAARVVGEVSESTIRGLVEPLLHEPAGQE